MADVWVARSIDELAKVIKGGLNDLVKTERRIKPGEIDYTMAEVHDTPTKDLCEVCYSWVWSFEEHKVNHMRFDILCQTRNKYTGETKEVYKSER